MKRILVVASTFPSRDNDPVPAFVKDQLIAMKKIDPELEFSVLAPHDKRSETKNFSQHDAYDEYRFHYFWPFSAEKLAGRGIMPALKANPANYLLIPFLFIGEFFALWRLTRKLRPDIIYAHWFTPQVVPTRVVSALTHIPFVFTTHASDVDVWHKIPVIGQWIVRNNTPEATAFTAVSQRSLAKLARFFDDERWNELKSRAQIIPMGVNLPNVTYVPAPNGEKNIVFIGRLAEKKGVQYLLPAYAQARPQLGTSRLIIAGDGPWLKQLQQQAAELGLGDSVSFPGYVSGDAKQALLASADIFVVPSIITSSGDAEGLPVSLMEGLAYGKVCIATNESGADDILTNGKDGFLVPQKDVAALSDALITAAQLGVVARLALQDSARETAAQFSWSTVARHHIAFLFNRTY